jgi:hypothetical protein
MLAPTLTSARPTTGAGDRVQQALGELGGVVLVADAGAEHGELVAAEAGHQVVLAHGPAEPVGHVDQQQVARLVPERVVDQLELVEVEEDQGDLAAVAAAVAQVAVERAHEQPAVGQAGQGVVGRLVLERRLPGAPLGDVLERPDEAGLAAAGPHRHDAGEDVAQLAVAADQAQGHLGPRTGEHAAQRGDGVLDVVPVQERQPLGAEQALGALAVHLAEAVVDVAQAQARLRREDGDRRLAGQGLEPLVRGAQVLGDAHQVGLGGQAQDPAPVADGQARQGHPHARAVAALEADAAAHGAAGVHEGAGVRLLVGRSGGEGAAQQSHERAAGELGLGVPEHAGAGAVGPLDLQRRAHVVDDEQRLLVEGGPGGDHPGDVGAGDRGVRGRDGRHVDGGEVGGASGSASPGRAAGRGDHGVAALHARLAVGRHAQHPSSGRPGLLTASPSQRAQIASARPVEGAPPERVTEAVGRVRGRRRTRRAAARPPARSAGASRGGP